jgi:plastocyanin
MISRTSHLDRRRFLSLAGAVLAAPFLDKSVTAADATATPTPAPSAAGVAEATPAGSPVASPVPTGPVFESTMESLKYLPPEIEISAGTTVVWTNKDVVAHTVTHKVKVEDQLFASPYLEPGQSFSYTFEKPGTYPVFCIPHPFMAQTVIVSEKKERQDYPSRFRNRSVFCAGLRGCGSTAITAYPSDSNSARFPGSTSRIESCASVTPNRDASASAANTNARATPRRRASGTTANRPI